MGGTPHVRSSTVGLRLLVLFMVILGESSGAVFAMAPRNMLQEAIGEYNAALDSDDHDLRTERFRRARRLFHQVVEDRAVRNADLYVNLGNAALQGEQLGDAILAYRRALEIEPGHRRATRNLEHARSILPQWVPRPEQDTLLDTFFFWHQSLSRSGRQLVATICFAMVCVLLAISIRFKRHWVRHAAVLLGVVWLALTALASWPWWVLASDQVVVTAPQVVARAADSSGAPASFAEPLPAGTEGEVIERRDQWNRIRLANNRDAWVRASAVTTVDVP